MSRVREWAFRQDPRSMLYALLAGLAVAWPLFSFALYNHLWTAVGISGSFIVLYTIGAVFYAVGLGTQAMAEEINRLVAEIKEQQSP